MDGKDHPVTSYISHCGPGTNFLDYSYISKIWTKTGPTLSSFPDLPIGKKTGPQRKKMPMDHPFILGFCQNVIFYIVFSILFSFVRKHQLS